MNETELTAAAIQALNAANKSGDDLQKQYVSAAISALNALLTSEITPRLASKIARFKVVLTDYAKQVRDAVQTCIDFAENGENNAD